MLLAILIGLVMSMLELHLLESMLKEEDYMLIKAKCKLINTQG